MAADQDDIRADVLTLLQNFRGVEPMKELFWSRLNYERVNRPTTRRGWPGSAAEVLADDPTLLAAGGQGGDFRVLYSRLAKDRLSLADERIVTSRLLKDHPYGLFIFSDRTQTNWHLLNVKMAEEEEKRKLFRRVTVGPNEKMRTACQVISQLDLASVSPNPFGLSPLVIQERHDQAFDVEPVTQAFYEQYKAVFKGVEGLIRGLRDEAHKRPFTQRLFNRLMFIAFIQKKGWLKFGKTNQDYLSALWADYKKNGDKDMGFYHERLFNLFFHGLGAQDDVGIIKINRGGFLSNVIGTVPYLNGGLFEEDEDDQDGGIKVPDEAIRSILQGLFEHFNFTVTEATPLDIEVAVDPEMLGKVFEELVTGRHETGSYYTPKPIVSFMCREALKGYLESNLPKDKPESVAKFVDEHDPGGLRDAEGALEALRRVRVCDPACGSGAYLLGMLHELMDLRTCLFSAKRVDPISAYDRKLEIIQRNVYGVDSDVFAVNIARLRLWLSLAVEFEGDDPPPLPNLKFEIEEGDSLAAPGPEPHQGVMWAKDIEQFGETKAKYIKAHGQLKKSLEQAVLELKHSIASWAHNGSTIAGFDWAVEYAEVFRDGGFDIVVANPPYVRMELFKEIKPVLRANFPLIHAERSDLYCYFYGRGIEILKPSGMLCFISSNKWFRAAYGARLRKYVSENCSISSITDFGELPVFKAATFPMIFVARKEKTSRNAPLFTQVTNLEHPYPDVLSLIKSQGQLLPADSVTGATWKLADSQASDILKTMEASSISLGQYCDGRIWWGVKTGLNDAFVLDEDQKRTLLKRCPEAKRVVKRLAVGDDIRKWKVDFQDQYLLYMPHGVDVRGLGAALDHIRPFRDRLEARATRQEWYELQQPQERYTPYFPKPKILYPEIAKEPRFTLDSDGYFVNNKVFVIPMNDIYLLGVLNSMPAWYYLKKTCSVLGDPQKGGRLELRAVFLTKLPIPKASAAKKAEIEELVRFCLGQPGEQCGNAEKDLDRIVASLYNLPPGTFDEPLKKRAAKAPLGI
jgi:hypothetical protein